MRMAGWDSDLASAAGHGIASIRTKILILIMAVTSATLILATGMLYAWAHQQNGPDLLITAAVLVVSIVVAYLLSTLFEGVITGPVDALVHAARNVVLAREREDNQLRNEFLMTLSHELRTPLHAIQGWTNLLSAGAVPPEDVTPVLHKIERNVRAQARLLEDLLEVSRFSAGRSRLESVPMDVVAVARLAIQEIRSAAVLQGITIEELFRVASARTMGDPDRLQRMFSNLLANAVKFSPRGSSVTCAIATTGRTHEIVIRDSGAGIDPAFLPFVFDAFRQADASTTRSHGGLGLGLAIASRIVELHGGSICAESAGLGRGTTLTVRLPATNAG